MRSTYVAKNSEDPLARRGGGASSCSAFAIATLSSWSLDNSSVAVNELDYQF